MLSEEKQTQFAALRRQIIAAEFGRMNPRQLEGVLTTEGPLLLLAGAGSGKTTVLINRIANLLRYGRGADSAEVPDHIEETDLAFLADYASKSDHTEQEDARAHLPGHCHYVYQQGGRGAEAALRGPHRPRRPGRVGGDVPLGLRPYFTAGH